MKFIYRSDSEGRYRLDVDNIITARDRRRIEASARRGAKLLDQERPDWFKPQNLSISTLDLSDCEVCVLGQVYADAATGSFDTGFHQGCRHLLRGVQGVRSAGEFGFDALEVSAKKTTKFPESFGRWDAADSTQEAVFVVLQAEWERQIRARRSKAAA